jgi:DNA-binding LacI/PurR family transcriptional regulator
MEPRRASMRDVARVAGLSLQTVSRVANGEPNVNHATRDRVLDVMRDLGYRPNLAARAMRPSASSIRDFMPSARGEPSRRYRSTPR